jgi:hypothetical protein
VDLVSGSVNSRILERKDVQITKRNSLPNLDFLASREIEPSKTIADSNHQNNIDNRQTRVSGSFFGTTRTRRDVRDPVAIGGKADLLQNNAPCTRLTQAVIGF